jgi:hypothetical protein
MDFDVERFKRLVSRLVRERLIDSRDFPKELFEVGTNALVHNYGGAIYRVIYSTGQKRKFLFSKARQAIEVGQLISAGR